MNQSNRNYETALHRLGKISTAVMLVALISVPIVMTMIFGIEVEADKTLTAFVGAFSLFGIIGAIEFFSYAPILGAGGQYLSFITGNIGNLKLPAALSGIKISGYATGSKEAEVISMISIAASSIMTTLIIFIGMLFVGQFLPLLQSPILAPAFSNLMPALLGALATPVFVKDLRTASVPCLAAAAVTLAIGYPMVARYQAFLMPVFLVIAVGWSFVLYKVKRNAIQRSAEEMSK